MLTVSQNRALFMLGLGQSAHGESVHELDDQDRSDRRHIMRLLQDISTRKHTIETTIRDEITRARSENRAGAERYWLMMLEWISEKFPEPENDKLLSAMDEMEEKIKN